MTTGILQERLLDAPDVCSNCMSLRLVERPQPSERFRTRALTASPYTMNPRTTSVEYANAESVSEQPGLFCDCGVESAYHRVWDEADESRFRDIIQNTLRVLRYKDVDHDAETVAAHALQAFRAGKAVNEALAAGIDAGVHRELTAADETDVPA